MKVVFTPEAADELEQVLEKISLVSPTGAKHVSQRIKRITEYLAAYPNAGRGTNNPDMRRVMATPYPYANLL